VKRFISIALVAFAAVLLNGCATTESENLSERPWNAPKSWEHGLPGGMMNQRY
jgi:PBP1b-binding outer membrane lipoprotein LpoB